MSVTIYTALAVLSVVVAGLVAGAFVLAGSIVVTGAANGPLNNTLMAAPDAAALCAIGLLA